MDLIKYEERLKAHNWNYKNCIGERWTEGHNEQKKLTQLSFLSPDHRRLFLKFKKDRGII